MLGMLPRRGRGGHRNSAAWAALKPDLQAPPGALRAMPDDILRCCSPTRTCAARASAVGSPSACRPDSRRAPARSLRALPDYSIDVAAEQAALAPARLVVWLQPVHWYGAPPRCCELSMDEVLTLGWVRSAPAAASSPTRTCHGPAAAGRQGCHKAACTARPSKPSAALPSRTAAALCQMRLPRDPARGAHHRSLAQIKSLSETLLERLRRHPTANRGYQPFARPGRARGPA